MIYFIQNEATLAIKIGFSDNVKNRVASLRTSSADRLRLLGVIPGDLAAEHRIHARFAADRLSGEWFRPTAELVDFVRYALVDRGGASPRSTLAVVGSGERYWTSKEGEALIPMLEHLGSLAAGFRVALVLVDVGAVEHVANGGPYVPRRRWQAIEDSQDVPDDVPAFDDPISAIHNLVSSATASPVA